MLNEQAPEKRVREYPGTLQVHSIFYTIQGEGPFAGTPAVFVRLAGCNLQCPGCDTEYTANRKNMTPIEIVSAIEQECLKGGRFAERKLLVVITGGEPFRQNIEILFHILSGSGFFVQVETNGTMGMHSLERNYYNTDVSARRGVYIVVSPKTGKIHKDMQVNACALKYVLGIDETGEDGLPLNALGHPASPRLARPPDKWDRPIYLQPQDYQEKQMNEESLRHCIRSCMRHGYILQLQVHKIIGME